MIKLKLSFLFVIMTTFYANAQIEYDLYSSSNQPENSLYLTKTLDSFNRKNDIKSNVFDSLQSLIFNKSTGYCKKIITALSYKAQHDFNKGIKNAYSVDYNFLRESNSYQIGFIEIIYRDSTYAMGAFKKFNIKAKRNRNLEKVIRKYKLMLIDNRLLVFHTVTINNPSVKDFLFSLKPMDPKTFISILR